MVGSPGVHTSEGFTVQPAPGGRVSGVSCTGCVTLELTLLDLESLTFKIYIAAVPRPCLTRTQPSCSCRLFSKEGKQTMPTLISCILIVPRSAEVWHCGHGYAYVTEDTVAVETYLM